MKRNKRLRVLRADQELSQLELAERASISRDRYWRIENGYAEPTQDEKAAIARVFELPTDEVFPAPQEQPQ